MGYGTYTIRKEQAFDYLAQVRTRGILISTKHDFWHLATGPLQVLFTGSPSLKRATVQSARVLRPHPPRGSPLYHSDAQAALYSLSEYLKNSWPWKEYAKTLKGNSVLPIILRSYGWAAETCPASDKGWHGFFAETPHGPRFLHPRELAVAHGFPWGFASPSCRTQAWQLLGNSIPLPMAYLGLLGPAAALQSLGRGEHGGS